MRTLLFSLLPLILALAACGGGGGGGDGPAGPPTGVADFLHLTTVDSTSNWWSVIDHPLTNGNPAAKLFVTHNWNPGGLGGTYHDHPLIVSYDEPAMRWRIQNEDGTAMPADVSFNVTAISGFSSAWTHRATPANIAGDRTYLDHSGLNGIVDARALVTKNLVLIGGIGTSNITPVGLWYHGAESQWAVFMQNPGIPMGEDIHYNVHVLPDDGSSLRHVATGSNTSGNWTTFSHPDADGNPNAHVQVTQGLGAGATKNDKDVGVFYNTGISQWAVFNEDSSTMPVNMVFYVRVKP